MSQISGFETKFSSQIIVDSNKRKGRYNTLPKNRGIDAIRNVKPRDSLEFYIKKAILTTSYCNGLLVGQGNSYLPFIFNALKYFNIAQWGTYYINQGTSHITARRSGNFRIFEIVSRGRSISI